MADIEGFSTLWARNSAHLINIVLEGSKPEDSESEVYDATFFDRQVTARFIAIPLLISEVPALLGNGLYFVYACIGTVVTWPVKYHFESCRKHYDSMKVSESFNNTVKLIGLIASSFFFGIFLSPTLNNYLHIKSGLTPIPEDVESRGGVEVSKPNGSEQHEHVVADEAEANDGRDVQFREPDHESENDLLAGGGGAAAAAGSSRNISSHRRRHRLSTQLMDGDGRSSPVTGAARRIAISNGSAPGHTMRLPATTAALVRDITNNRLEQERKQLAAIDDLRSPGAVPLISEQSSHSVSLAHCALKLNSLCTALHNRGLIRGFKPISSSEDVVLAHTIISMLGELQAVLSPEAAAAHLSAEEALAAASLPEAIPPIANQVDNDLNHIAQGLNRLIDVLIERDLIVSLHIGIPASIENILNKFDEIIKDIEPDIRAQIQQQIADFESSALLPIDSPYQPGAANNDGRAQAPVAPAPAAPPATPQPVRGAMSLPSPTLYSPPYVAPSSPAALPSPLPFTPFQPRAQSRLSASASGSPNVFGGATPVRGEEEVDHSMLVSPSPSSPLPPLSPAVAATPQTPANGARVRLAEGELDPLRDQ